MTDNTSRTDAVPLTDAALRSEKTSRARKPHADTAPPSDVDAAADDVSRLFDLADLVLAVGRLLRPPHDPEFTLTPVETAVMRFIDRNPGTSARAAAEGTLLASSNFSRALRTLEERGFVRREADERDARSVRIYPTPHAAANLARLREIWSDALAGAVDTERVELVNETLRELEHELARRQRGQKGGGSNRTLPGGRSV